jgi:nitrogen regulatory protein P-II 1
MPLDYMKLAIVFLHKSEYLEELLSMFLEIGVTGATVLDSVGMGHIISENIPIFAGLREAFVGSSPRNKVILIVTEAALVKTIAEAVDEVCNQESSRASSFVVTLPIDEIHNIDF